MEFDHTELLRVFIAEAEENLAAIEDGLLQLEARPDDTRQLDHVFRAAQTLKGNSSALGFAGMGLLVGEHLRTLFVSAEALAPSIAAAPAGGRGRLRGAA